MMIREKNQEFGRLAVNKDKNITPKTHPLIDIKTINLNC